MPYQSTVLGQLFKALPRGRFERLARQHHSGRQKRELSPWAHVVAMVFAHIGGARGLREVEAMFERHRGIGGHLGLGAVRRSTLGDANRERPAELFCALAELLAGDLTERRLPGAAIKLVDATRIFAGKRIEHWAPGGGVKLHVVHDAEGGYPTCFAVTPERLNDITFAQSMAIMPGATYVFDKAYYDFAFWAKLDGLGCRFVTRLKVNSPTTLVSEREVDQDGDILFDHTVRLSDRLKSTRHNPLDKPLRLIGVRIAGGRPITLVSNDLHSEAQVIAALYKSRWQIELFFKWLKQNLKLDHFLGTSRNAVTIQIMAALIAFLLMRLAQHAIKATLPLQAIARLIRPMALTRRPIGEVFFPPPPPPIQPTNQLSLALNHA
jgi:hypothetical protein